MNQRLMLIIAAALTAFILVMGSGLITYMTRSSAQAAATPVAPTDGTAQLDPTIEALIQQREQAYKQALDEANRRLEQANQQLGQQANSTNTTQPGRELSAEQAQTIALNMAPGAKGSKAPELVSYQGSTAYEVILDRGTVYIEAQTGAILASTIATNAPNVETNSAPSDSMSQEQAAQLAMSYRRSGTVSGVRSVDDGLVYEISFDDGVVMYLDSVNGQLLQVERAAPAEREHEDDHNDHEQHDDDDEHEG